jgi:transcriptional regulator with XRE-family HTH domain
MRSLAELARTRIVGWMATNPRITQTTIAQAVGVSQAWVSQYKSGDQDADIDQLDAMARVFGHTLAELIDLRPDPNERELLDAYRKVVAEARPVALQAVQAMAGVLKPPPPRKRTP